MKRGYISYFERTSRLIFAKERAREEKIRGYFPPRERLCPNVGGSPLGGSNWSNNKGKGGRRPGEHLYPWKKTKNLSTCPKRSDSVKRGHRWRKKKKRKTSSGKKSIGFGLRGLGRGKWKYHPGPRDIAIGGRAKNGP